MMNTLIYQYLIFSFLTIFSILNNDLYITSIVSLWSLVLIITLDVLRKKTIDLLIVFLISFVYMIPSEGILNYKKLYSNWGVENVNYSYSILITTAFLIFSGFNLKLKQTNVNYTSRIEFNTCKQKKLVVYIAIYNFFYFLIHLKMIVNNLFFGRGSVENFFNIQLTAIALIFLALLPTLVNNKWKLLFLSLPTFIVLFGTGTRLFIVYGLFMLITNQLMEIKFKKLIRLSIVVLPILFLMNFIKDIRSTGIMTNTESISSDHITYNSFSEKIASYGSSEGLIRNIAMITDYTSKNDFTYGKSIGFLLYWWVPREIWPEKPVMLDYWLIREYEDGFSTGHSTASSYMGEVYMDFGYINTLIIFFIFGCILALIQNWININFKKNLYTLVIGSFLYGWVFFGTRSIMTATFMLIWIYIFLKIIIFLLKKYNYLYDTNR